MVRTTTSRCPSGRDRTEAFNVVVIALLLLDGYPGADPSAALRVLAPVPPLARSA